MVPIHSFFDCVNSIDDYFVNITDFVWKILFLWPERRLENFQEIIQFIFTSYSLRRYTGILLFYYHLNP